MSADPSESTSHLHAEPVSNPVVHDQAGIDRYVVAGNPVAHSRSPEIHATFAAQTGQSLVYERLLCPLDGFEASIRAFVAAGGRGCNVTVPFKFEAFRLAVRRTPRAQLAGAVNTFRFDDASAGGWLGDNTDGAGLLADIERNAARPLRSLITGRPAEIRVINRNADKALALADSHRAWAAEHGVRLSAGGLDAPAPEGRHEVVINGTSASLSGAGLPLPDPDAPVLAPGGLAVDMMYGPSTAPFLDWAAGQAGSGGAQRDGLGMLVEQAAEAFLLWRGVRPDSATVLAALRQRLAAH